jgi:hypothetical protein
LLSRKEKKVEEIITIGDVEIQVSKHKVCKAGKDL